MKNKDYIKKGQEYLEGLKQYAYGSFVLEIGAVILLLILYFAFK